VDRGVLARVEPHERHLPCGVARAERRRRPGRARDPLVGPGRARLAGEAPVDLRQARRRRHRGRFLRAQRLRFQRDRRQGRQRVALQGLAGWGRRRSWDRARLLVLARLGSSLQGGDGGNADYCECPGGKACGDAGEVGDGWP
jgi:hypothetical protein